MLKRKRADDDNTKQETNNIASADLDKNDVLSGRGDNINRHPGNKHFRNLVEKKKKIYSTSQFKREKQMIAFSIVSEIRELEPPGRFLSQDPHSGLWHEIGDEKAREKTSQALREKSRPVRGVDKETEVSSSNAKTGSKSGAKRPATAERSRSSSHSHPLLLPPPPPPLYGSAWSVYPPNYYAYGQHPPAMHPSDPQRIPPHYYPPYHQYPYPAAANPMLQIPTLSSRPPAPPPPPIVPPIGYGPYRTEQQHANIPVTETSSGPAPSYPTNSELKETSSASGSDHGSVGLEELHLSCSQPEPSERPIQRQPRISRRSSSSSSNRDVLSGAKSTSCSSPDFHATLSPRPPPRHRSHHFTSLADPSSTNGFSLDSPGSMAKLMEELVESPGTLEQLLSPSTPDTSRHHHHHQQQNETSAASNVDNSLRYSPIRLTSRATTPGADPPIVSSNSVDEYY